MVTISRTNSLAVSSRLVASSSRLLAISGAILKLNLGYSIVSATSSFSLSPLSPPSEYFDACPETGVSVVFSGT
jgi:hypothetical protein